VKQLYNNVTRSGVVVVLIALVPFQCSCTHFVYLFKELQSCHAGNSYK